MQISRALLLGAVLAVFAIWYAFGTVALVNVFILAVCCGILAIGFDGIARLWRRLVKLLFSKIGFVLSGGMATVILALVVFMLWIAGFCDTVHRHLEPRPRRHILNA